MSGEGGRWWSIPNLFTFLRVALVPVILLLLVRDGETARWWAFGIFVVAALTDTLDGTLARRWDGVTPFGELLDPLADKVLIVGALVSLALVGDVAWWVVVVILVRELAVTALRVALLRRHGTVMAASAWGKAKTIVQIVAVSLVLLPPAAGSVAQAALALAVAFTIGSGIDYGVRVAREARRAGTQRPIAS